MYPYGKLLPPAVCSVLPFSNIWLRVETVSFVQTTTTTTMVLVMAYLLHCIVLGLLNGKWKMSVRSVTF